MGEAAEPGIGQHNERLSELSAAGLRINESLDLDAVLQEVAASARSLTGARYSLITTVDDSGRVVDHVASGLTPQEATLLWATPGGPEIYDYLSSLREPLRVADFAAHAEAAGLPKFRLPVDVSAYVVVPVRHRAMSIGSIHVAKDSPGAIFTQHDEDVLVLFASQVALAVANARTHRVELRAKADLESLIDTSPVGVAVLDLAHGVLVNFNREARRIVQTLCDQGQAPEELLDSITVRRSDGSEIYLEQLPIFDALKGEETVRAEEIVLMAPAGRRITVLVNASFIRSETGEAQSAVITLQDLTSLEELARMRAEFLAMVSHELRSPLTSIRGATSAMLDATSDLDPAEMRQFLRIIDDQADNMRELVSNLLDVARIETGTLPVSAEPVEVPALVDRARSIFESTGNRHRLELDCAPDLPLAMADRRRIVQVIGNLLSNAARNSRESSIIKLSAAQEGDFVAVSVADEGRGIPAERLAHLFRKFSRVESDDHSGDTGLGLAICKGIVEAHGGRIRAQSDGEGLGTRFTFTIPAATVSPTAGAGDSRAVSPLAHQSEPVLVVDDDPETLRFVRRALTGAGLDPTVTADSKDVLTLVERKQPKLVLLDLMLPDADGIDLMRDIHAVRDVPIVFLSGYGRDDVIVRAFDAGAVDYIVKPFSPTELVARVRAAIRRHADPFRNEPSEPFVLGDLTVDYERRLVTVAGQRARLTATEYRLLYELSTNAGRVLTHDQLLRRIWGANKPGDVRSLRTHVRRLRGKLGETAQDPTYIVAEPRVGYRMAADGPQPAAAGTQEP